MRLIITGKSRSGKSTALHRLVKTALQATWANTLIADGKSVELTRYATPQLRVYGEDEAEAFATALTATADRLTARYQALTARGLAAAQPGDPRELLIVDEVQEFTRHTAHGKAVKAALTRIFEKSGALGDLVIIATQRATNAIPPSARVNANIQLRLLGSGYYQLVADDHPTRQGRVDRLAPPAPPTALTPEALPLVLSTQAVEREPTSITRYEGGLGSGRTYALERHLSDPAYRRVFLDLKTHSHRSLLVHSLRTCGATPPEGAPLGELAEAAALALQSRPTLLLLDNCEHASPRVLASVLLLLDAATAAAVSMTPPTATDPAKDPLIALRRRATLIPIQPLEHGRAAALLDSVAPQLDPASKATILRQAQGHPRTILAYAERLTAHGAEERHTLEAVKRPARWLNILFMFAILVAIILIQRHISNDIAGSVLSGVVVMTMWFLRPRFREVTKK
jgi:AAA domain-containing protein